MNDSIELYDELHSMSREPLSIEEANENFWLMDRPGLLCSDTEGLTTYQKIYARDKSEINGWDIADKQNINLMDVVKNIKPTILIGCSAVAGAFSKEIILEMTANTERPIILPLSNPTERCEATPEDLYKWTNGKVLIATGSPFDPITYEGKKHRIAQCNNALVFPGIGLGLIAAKATKCSDECLWKACSVLSHFSPIRQDPTAPLLPDLGQARQVAKQIAIAVAKQVSAEGNAQVQINDNIDQIIDELMWEPNYVPYQFRVK